MDVEAGHGLIEREPSLTALDGALDGVRGGRGGHLVLVTGEPGAGKSALVRAFARRAVPDVDVLVGWCDNLRTARPFGPLHDVAARHHPELDALLERGAERGVVLREAFGMLHGPRPTILVLEDVHWADEATLDLISYLGRRVSTVPALLILTYRPEEVRGPHPLAVVLGDLATVRPLRLPVEPLSVAGVAALSEGTGIEAEALHRRTGGNAFFVTECLSAGVDDVPATVRDAVHARRSRLSPAAQMALDIASIVPGSVEAWLMEGLQAPEAGVDECVDAGVLVPAAAGVSFRHELARLAVLDALPVSQRRALHAAAVSCLSAPLVGQVDHARVAHHAAEAGDVDALLQASPAAADDALAAGARREAVAHLQRAVQFGSRLAPVERASLWLRLGAEESRLADYATSAAALRTAAEIYEEAADVTGQAAALTELYGALLMDGRQAEADRALETALSLLEPLGPSAALAQTYEALCSAHMLARRLAEAEVVGQQAMALAASVGDLATVARASIQSGVALLMGGDEAGLQRIHDGIALAERLGRGDLVSLGYSQIGSGGGEVRRYADAVPALRRCWDEAEQRELRGSMLYSTVWLGRCEFEQGRWSSAANHVGEALRSPHCSGVTELTALAVLGRLRARRGDPDVWSPLDRALLLAEPTGHLQRLWPVAAARAEAAWLEGRLEDEVDLVLRVRALADELRYPWAQEELEWWARQAGQGHEAATGGATPFSLQCAGRAEAAASAWAALGCPYEEALARASSEDLEQLRAARRTFEELGARPAATLVTGRLRALGASVPRGPNRATRANPGGLSDREIEVLQLVAAGRSNREVAQELRISVKTVGHHVSHVLTKLGARSRAEAVAKGAQLGLPLDTIET